MTTAEAREKLTQHGLSPDQATGVVDVLERWERERVVTREYLDARLAEYYGRIESRLSEHYGKMSDRMQAQTETITGKLQAQTESISSKLVAQTIWIAGTVALGVIVQHLWK